MNTKQLNDNDLLQIEELEGKIAPGFPGFQPNTICWDE